MIFVTVGTHEQQFNRLIEYMDKWASIHDEEVIMQIGYCTYRPKVAKWSKLYPYSKMIQLVEEARIVITHGGPSSFIMPLQMGKTPIVVPRKHVYDEHVNDHQVKFCKAVEHRMKNIRVIENIEELGKVIETFNDIKSDIVNIDNNAKFCKKLEDIVDEMFKRKR